MSADAGGEGPPPATVTELPPVDDLVLALVDQVPPGRVTTYGELGRLAGVGPRRAGRTLAQHGHLVAWWRVVRADGRPPQGHQARALARYLEEGTPLRPDGSRVDLGRARAVLRPLPPPGG